MPRRSDNPRRKDGVSPYHGIHQATSREMPAWIVPPFKFCGPLTRELMDVAWRRGRFLVVKSSDGKRLALSHYSRGVRHIVENTDLGKETLLRLLRARDGADALDATGDDSDG